MGCSITLLLERVDFTGRTKWPVGGLIETCSLLVWGCAGERLIPFPVFSVLSSRLARFSCWARNARVRLSAVLLALLRDSNAWG